MVGIPKPSVDIRDMLISLANIVLPLPFVPVSNTPVFLPSLLRRANVLITCAARSLVSP